MAENSSQTAGEISGGENFKKIAKLGIILFTVTAITGLILGVVHEITLVPIQQTQERLKNEALEGVLPDADSFTPIDIAENADPVITEINEAKKGGEPAGYCITVKSKGYGGPIEMVVGIPSTGGVRAIRILGHTETPGLGAKAPLPQFSGQFDNVNADRLSVVKSASAAPGDIQAISGATITSNAVADGVNVALEYWSKELKGGI
ncbi:MAG: RnfABCDGE type electron transport complex subunit G [Synergistaceae bacterium]|jgi:electron transport complex protein RnfG|nr:RnfABCDGE type electron transport complex subunit G [Synergistaceae bacterium]